MEVYKAKIYGKTRDYNNKSGNNLKPVSSMKNWKRFQVKSLVKPIATASNLKKRKISTDQHDFDELIEDCDSPIQDSDSYSPKSTKKRKVSRIQRELQNWSTALLADAKDREQAKERCRREIISESKAVTEAYKEMMGKLIEKLFYIFPY